MLQYVAVCRSMLHELQSELRCVVYIPDWPVNQGGPPFGAAPQKSEWGRSGWYKVVAPANMAVPLPNLAVAPERLNMLWQ